MTSPAAALVRGRPSPLRWPCAEPLSSTCSARWPCAEPLSSTCSARWPCAQPLSSTCSARWPCAEPLSSTCSARWPCAEPLFAAFGLAPAQHKSKECLSGGEPLATVSDLTGPGIEHKTSCTGSDVLNHYTNRPVSHFILCFAVEEWIHLHI